MSWDRAFAGEREQAARGPQPANPATLGEIWRAGWDSAGLGTGAVSGPIGTGPGRPRPEAT